MSYRPRLSDWARVLLRGFSGLLVAAILLQFFIAGMSSLTNPDWWDYHKTWVWIFQWLVLPLPIFALFCEQPRAGRVFFSLLPTVQIGLQYVLVHRALEGHLLIGAGLHAVNAAIMLIVVPAERQYGHDAKNILRDR